MKDPDLLILLEEMKTEGHAWIEESAVEAASLSSAFMSTEWEGIYKGYILGAYKMMHESKIRS